MVDVVGDREVLTSSGFVRQFAVQSTETLRRTIVTDAASYHLKGDPDGSGNRCSDEGARTDGSTGRAAARAPGGPGKPRAEELAGTGRGPGGAVPHRLCGCECPCGRDGNHSAAQGDR